MSKSQRTKGAEGERSLCALLSSEFGLTIKRKLGQARDSGNDIDAPPFRIECKRRKRAKTLYDWMRQVEKDMSAGDTPVVALRADGEEWLVFMRLPDWCRIAREEISK